MLMTRAQAGKRPTIIVRPHPGSTWEEILNEPDWAVSRPHRPGHKDPQGRYAGSTHISADFAEKEEAQAELRDLEARAQKGELLNFREIIDLQKEIEVFFSSLMIGGKAWMLSCLGLSSSESNFSAAGLEVCLSVQ